MKRKIQFQTNALGEYENWLSLLLNIIDNSDYVEYSKTIKKV